MTKLNLQQRFLLLFADYRAVLEENTRLGDEILQVRTQIEEERRRYDDLTNRTLALQGDMMNRLMTPPPAPPRVELPKQNPEVIRGKMAHMSRVKNMIQARAAKLNNAPLVTPESLN